MFQNLCLLWNLLSVIRCGMIDTFYCNELCKPEMLIPLTCKCEWSRDCSFFEDGTYDMPWHQLRHALLNAHNKFRNQFALAASNLEKDHGFKGAANMLAFSYDYDLEYVAKCHTQRCVIDNHCVITRNYRHGGRNTYTRPGITRDPNLIARGALRTWYEMEIIQISKKLAIIDSTNYGPLPQVVWANTEAIGCWASKGTMREYTDLTTKNDTVPVPWERMLVVCVYGPGMVVGGTVYVKGPAASQCPPKVKPNKRYPGLCGKSVLPPAPVKMKARSQDDYDYDELNSSSIQQSSRFGIALLVIVCIMCQ